MKAILEQLHHELLADLNRIWQLELPEAKRVESCYHVATDYWLKVKEVFKEPTVYNEQEEICFFKELKPLFTCHIEYYLILNQALLFLPEDPEIIVGYWQGELKRYFRFYEKHRDFIKYFEGYSTEYDSEYFTRRNNRLQAQPQERIYDDEDCRSTHDQIVRGLMANSMYYEYAGKKLEELLPGASKRFPARQIAHRKNGLITEEKKRKKTN